MTTLLEKARKIHPIRRGDRKYTDEDLKLVIAHLNGEITPNQVMEVKGISTNQRNRLYHYVNTVLMWGIGKKLISIRVPGE